MAGAFTAVDLSKVPAPTIVEQLDYEQILAEMVSYLKSVDPVFDAIVESDPIFKLLEAIAYREVLIRQRVNDASRGVMLSYAAGSDLDQIAAMFGVTRIAYEGDNYNRMTDELLAAVVAAMQQLPDISVSVGVDSAGATITGVKGRSVHEDIVLPVIRTWQKSRDGLVPNTNVTYRSVRGVTTPGKMFCLVTKAQAEAELTLLQALWAEAQSQAEDAYQDAVDDATDDYNTEVAAIDALKIARIQEILEDDHLASVNAAAERIDFFNLSAPDENPVRRLALDGAQLYYEARRLQRQKDEYDADNTITLFAYRRPALDAGGYASLGTSYTAAVDNTAVTAFLNDWTLTKTAYDTAVATAEAEFAPDYADAITDRDAAIAAAAALIPSDRIDFADTLLLSETLTELEEWDANSLDFVSSDLLVGRWVPEAIERLATTLGLYNKRLIEHCQTIRKLATNVVAGHRIIQTTRQQVLDDIAVLPPAPPSYETDADFRRRVQLALEGFSTAGPIGGYIFHALGSDPRVLDVSVQSPTPGDVLITVLAREDDGTASADLLAVVETTLTDDEIRPLTDQVTVQGATIISYTVDAAITVYPGPDASTILEAAEADLAEYCEQNHRLGRSITLSGLFAALHQEGVQNVVINSPVANIITTPSQAPFVTSKKVTVGTTDD